MFTGRSKTSNVKGADWLPEIDLSAVSLDLFRFSIRPTNGIFQLWMVGMALLGHVSVIFLASRQGRATMSSLSSKFPCDGFLISCLIEESSTKTAMSQI